MAVALLSVGLWLRSFPLDPSRFSFLFPVRRRDRPAVVREERRPVWRTDAGCTLLDAVCDKGPISGMSGALLIEYVRVHVVGEHYLLVSDNNARSIGCTHGMVTYAEESNMHANKADLLFEMDTTPS